MHEFIIYFSVFFDYNGGDILGVTVMKADTKKAILCAALGNIIWGFSFLFIKLGLGAVANSNILLSHRFLLSALIMLLYLITGKKKFSLKGKNWKPVLLLMLAQVGYYIFETQGIQHTTTTIAGLVLAVVPVVTIGTGALFLKEYPTRRQALFCILPVAGVIIMTVSGQELGVASPLGILFLLITLLMSTLYKTANRKAALEFTPYERTLLVLSASAVFFTLTALNAVDWNLKTYLAPLASGKYLICIFSLSFLCSIAANLLVNYASAKMSVFKVASFGSLSTLCSTVIGVLFLHEPVNVSLLIGAVLILVGIREVTKPK